MLPLSCRVQGVQGELGLWGKGEVRCCSMATAMLLVSLVGMRRMVWTGAENKTAVESKSYHDQQRECFRCLLRVRFSHILVVSKQEVQALHWAVSLACLPPAQRRKLTVVCNPDSFKEDGRTTQTIYLESNDLGAPRKTICLVVESMRGWPANAHP